MLTLGTNLLCCKELKKVSIDVCAMERAGTIRSIKLKVKYKVSNRLEALGQVRLLYCQSPFHIRMY